MQFAKDSFYMALRDRLAAANPARTVTMNGTTRPAVVVVENEPATSTARVANTFYLEWSEVQVAKVDNKSVRPLLALLCRIEYGTSGLLDGQVDRGRTLAALDNELLTICSPGRTKKQGFTQTPAADLGSYVIWTKPTFGEVKSNARPGLAISRHGDVHVFFFPEVDLP